MTTPHAIVSLDPDGDHQVHPTTAHPGLSIPVTGMDLAQLRRFQWAVRVALVLGVAASVAANVLHAREDLIAQTIAAWPPLALMLTVELISRVPIYRRALAVVRLLATSSIAGIAAYVSYFHMAAVVSQFGEHQPNPYLLPISVDGLIVVASVSLVELAGRIRTIHDEIPATHPADSLPASRQPLSDSGTASAPQAERAGRSGQASTAAQAARPVRTSAWPLTAPSAPTVAPPSLVGATPSEVRPPLSTALPAMLANAPVAEPTVPPPVEPASATTPPDSAPSSSNEPPPETPSAARSTLGAKKPKEERDELDPELAALLPAARDARNALRHQRLGLTRDSLAAQLRRDGHTIRTSRVSALLNLLRQDEPATVNGRSSSGPS